MLTGMATTTARGIGRTDLEAEWSLTAFVVHVVLAFLLVRAYGLRGALVAIVTGNVVGAAWLLSRLAGVMRWPRVELLLAPLGVPALAVLAGAGAGRLVAVALPDARGLAAWLVALAVAVAGAAVVLIAVFALRYLSVDEVRGLLRRPAPEPGASR
jgi:O-antigen/teichoic acid export membrane protein